MDVLEPWESPNSPPSPLPAPGLMYQYPTHSLYMPPRMWHSTKRGYCSALLTIFGFVQTAESRHGMHVGHCSECVSGYFSA